MIGPYRHRDPQEDVIEQDQLTHFEVGFAAAETKAEFGVRRVFGGCGALGWRTGRAALMDVHLANQHLTLAN